MQIVRGRVAVACTERITLSTSAGTERRGCKACSLARGTIVGETAA